MEQEAQLYVPNVRVQQDGQRVWLGKTICGRYGLEPGDVVDVYLGDAEGNPDDVNREIDDQYRLVVRKKVMRREGIEPDDDIDLFLEVRDDA